MKTLGISLSLTGYICAYVLAAFDPTSTLVTVVVGHARQNLGLFGGDFVTGHRPAAAFPPTWCC